MLLILIIIVISRIHQHFPALSFLRPAFLATGLVVLYAYLNSRLLARGSVLKTWPGKVVAGMFVMACLSVPMGISPGASGSYILNGYLKTMVLTFLIVASVRNVRDLYTLTWALVISCGILSYMALFLFQLEDLGDYARLHNLYRYDANDVGAVLTGSLGLVLLHIQTAPRAGKVVSFIVLLMMLAAIARTGSRGAMVGLVIAGVAMLLFTRSLSIGRRIGIASLAVLALTFTAPRGYWMQMSTILEPADDYNYTNTDGRKQIAERGIGYMLQYPLFGVGIGNFAKAECTISPIAKSASPYSPLRCVAPHNSYIEAGAELGIPGLLLFAGLILGGIIGPLRLRKRLPPEWQRGDAEERYLFAATGFIPVAVAGYAASIFFLSFAWLDNTYVLAAILAGLYLACSYKLRQNQLYPKPPGLFGNPIQNKAAIRRLQRFNTPIASQRPLAPRTADAAYSLRS